MLGEYKAQFKFRTTDVVNGRGVVSVSASDALHKFCNLQSYFYVRNDCSSVSSDKFFFGTMNEFRNNYRCLINEGDFPLKSVSEDELYSVCQRQSSEKRFYIPFSKMDFCENKLNFVDLVFGGIEQRIDDFLSSAKVRVVNRKGSKSVVIPVSLDCFPPDFVLSVVRAGHFYAKDCSFNVSGSSVLSDEFHLSNPRYEC